MWDAWAMAMTCIARWSKALPGADILPVLARSVIFPHALNGMPPRPTAANMRLHSILPNNNQRILESANGLGFSQARFCLYTHWTVGGPRVMGGAPEGPKPAGLPTE